MSTQNSGPGKGAGQIVAEARKTTQEITAGQARQELDQGHVALLLDVREPAEWEKGHIPGAVLAPRGMLEWYADPFWFVASALAALLIGITLSLLGRRFTPKFTLTRLQWLGLGLLSLVLFLAAFLLSTHGTHLREAIPIATAIAIVFAIQLGASRGLRRDARSL